MKRTDDFMVELARRGVPARLAELEKELQAIHARFPEFFPSGRPVLTQAERRNVSDKAVERMIASVEARHGNGNGKDPLGAVDAAKAFGLYPTTVYKKLKESKLKPADHKGNRKSARYHYSDLEHLLNGTNQAVQETGV